MEADSNMDQSLLGLLNQESLASITAQTALLKQYNEPTREFILLYFQANQLCKLSIEYSQERFVHGKPLSAISTVQQKIEYAQAMLAFYKSALACKTNQKYLLIFINTTLSNALEKLLQIHGASGYMQHNTSAQLWLDCRERILHITQQLISP